MTTRILVPLDGSSLAEQALYRARELALSTSGSLLLVRCVLTRAFPGTDPTKQQVRVVEEAERYLAGVARRLEDEYLGVETAVAYGDPAEMIVDEVRIRNADYIVMATHGHGGVGRWLYGSVAEAVIARSPIPVLLVHDSGGERPGWLTGAPRIVVPLDGSAFAEEALPTAFALAHDVGGSVTLVRAVPPLSYGPPYGYSIVATPATDEMTDGMQRHRLEVAHEYLDGIARRYPGTVVHVAEGRPERVIAQVAEREHAALVVMTTHGRTGLARFVIGSVAMGVLRRGPGPVLLIRPERLRRAMEAPSETRANVELDEDQIVLIRTGLRMLAQTIADDQLDLRSRVRLVDGVLSAAQEQAHPSAPQVNS